MSKGHYVAQTIQLEEWADFIQQHSVAKHRILQSYLAAYFRTLVSSPNQDLLRLTLVDGFAGGGLYVHNDTRELVKGSPFIFLNATREAEYLINKDRQKPVRLDVDYFFVEADKHAHTHLDKVLRDDGTVTRSATPFICDMQSFKIRQTASLISSNARAQRTGVQSLRSISTATKKFQSN